MVQELSAWRPSCSFTISSRGINILGYFFSGPACDRANYEAPRRPPVVSELTNPIASKGTFVWDVCKRLWLGGYLRRTQSEATRLCELGDNVRGLSMLWTLYLNGPQDCSFIACGDILTSACERAELEGLRMRARTDRRIHGAWGAQMLSLFWVQKELELHEGHIVIHATFQKKI